MPNSAKQLRLSSDDFSGTNREYVEWNFTRDVDTVAPVIRVVNDLDVSVDLDAAGTDSLDTNRNRIHKFTYYGTDHIGMSPFRSFGNVADNGESISLASASEDTRILNQVWNIIRVGVTPSSEPSSGEIKIIYID